MRQYSEEFDCYYDDELNVWLENRCSDKDCDYCSKRPERPNDN